MYQLVTDATTAQIDAYDFQGLHLLLNIRALTSPASLAGFYNNQTALGNNSLSSFVISRINSEWIGGAVDRYVDPQTQNEHLRFSHPTANVEVHKLIDDQESLWGNLIHTLFLPENIQTIGAEYVASGVFIADPVDPDPIDPDPTDPDPVDPDPTDPDPVDPDPTDPEEPSMPTPTPTYGFGIVFSVAAAAALRAQLDEQVGFQKSTSNVIVNGVTGISQPVTWDLEDPDTDAGYLNSHQVTTLIQNQGLRFWGNRNCSEDPRFSFEVATRTAQIVLETIVQGCAIFADQPLIPQLAKDIIDSIQAKLDEFTAAGQLIGASVWYDPAENSTEALSQGQFWVDYDYTSVPTLENLGLNQRITDRYLVDFAKLIAQAA